MKRIHWFLLVVAVFFLNIFGLHYSLAQELRPTNAGADASDQRVLAIVVKKEMWIEEPVSGDDPRNVMVYKHKAGNQSATVQQVKLKDEAFDEWLREDVKLLQKNWPMTKVKINPKIMILGRNEWRVIEWHVNFFMQTGLDKNTRENLPSSFMRFVHKDPLSKLIAQVTWEYQGNEPDIRDITEFVERIDGFRWEKESIEALPVQGVEGLVGASVEGRLSDVLRILDEGVKVDAKIINGFTALIGASGSGQIDVVKALVERGADVNAQNSEGMTALIASADMAHPNIADFLIKSGANVNAKAVDGRTALIMAARKGDLATVKILLENGADVNAKTSNGATALIAVAYKGYGEIAKILCDYGADVKLKTSDGRTALSVAESKGFAEIIRLLREKSK